MRWRDLGHLTVRFFTVLRGRGPTPAAQAEAARLLRAEERRLFWGQQRIDQRHAIDAALLVLEQRPDDRVMARAALLHDVGKRHSRLGALGRAAASVLTLLRLPTSGRLATYIDHGPIGGRELEAAGAEPLVVAYAAHHQRERPDSVPEDVWSLLVAADRGA